jgi:hypothetical protein
MRTLTTTTLALFALLLAGCPKGERCDMATYAGGCDGKGSWSYCSDKDSSGFEKLWPTVQRHECKQATECVEAGDISTCVAAPAERCELKDDERCVDGGSQRCWALGSQPGAPLYWHYVGLTCE